MRRRARRPSGVPLQIQVNRRIVRGRIRENGRSGGIRTHDPFTPSEVRYQAAPYSVLISNLRRMLNQCNGIGNYSTGSNRFLTRMSSAIANIIAWRSLVDLFGLSGASVSALTDGTTALGAAFKIDLTPCSRMSF